MEALNITARVAVQKASSGQKNIMGNLEYSSENRIGSLPSVKYSNKSLVLCITAGFLHNIWLSPV